MAYKNKVIWIVGASSGIGAALAKKFAKLDAKLILTSRNEQALMLVQEECQRHTSYCSILRADMLQQDSLKHVTETALKIYGGIDAVIFSAGKSQRSLAINTDLSVYKQLIDLNFFAPVIITKILLPHFQKMRSGHIVAISSVAGLMGVPLRTGYAASKHALKGFFESLQTEHDIEGLAITIVSPGRINTPISVNALTADGTAHGKMDKGQLQGIPVDECAENIIKAMKQKRKHLIIARQERILWWLWWYARRLYYKVARKKGGTH